MDETKEGMKLWVWILAAALILFGVIMFFRWLGSDVPKATPTPTAQTGAQATPTLKERCEVYSQTPVDGVPQECLQYFQNDGDGK